MAHSGQEMKKLGFGLMRLPMKDGEHDIEQIKEMVDLFMEAGFTYFDTAWVYTGSEDAIRQALVERYPRESFQLATKLAAWVKCETAEDAQRQLEDSLRQTGAGYFDFYLLHNLGETRTRFFDEFGLWDWVQEKKAEGVLHHVGFSFHATPEELDALLTAHPEVDFVQLQVNYADWENPAIQSRACYQVARAHGKPVVVMEPVKGGMLATPPAEVTQVLKAAEPDSSPASWALRFAADLEGVMMVLSGMSNVEQMKENLATMGSFTGLTGKQREVLDKAQEIINNYPLIPCTNCNYCAKVCPMEIGIPGTFTAMNYLTLYGDKESAAREEHWLVPGHGRKRAPECVHCGLCEEACPQHIAIRDELERACEALEIGRKDLGPSFGD